jgi:hypothetical protein
MRRVIPAGFLVVLSVSGCATMKGTSPSVPPGAAQPAASTANSNPQSPLQPQSQGEPAASPGQPAAAGSDSAVASAGVQSAAAVPSESAAESSGTEKPKSSVGNRPAKHTGTAGPVAGPPAAPAATSNQAPAAPTLDLAALEQRLRDTRAIGVFTKLSLKNQVDDLLAEFRALYKGPNKHPTPQLRQRYDLLLLKVLSLLQDGDPNLAAAISSSREAIWGILADPEKFAKI